MTATAKLDTIDALRGIHEGARMLVCGLGPSLELLADGIDVLTIGVNDIGRHFDPDYLVFGDEPESFGSGHQRANSRVHIVDCRPTYATVINERYAQAWLPLLPGHSLVLGAPVVGIRLPGDIVDGQPVVVPELPDPVPGWESPGGDAQLHIGGGSPLFAASLAGFLGARDVGVIGADLRDIGHWQLQLWNGAWRNLRKLFASHGIALWNLSPRSRLDERIPRKSLTDWLAEGSV